MGEAYPSLMHTLLQERNLFMVHMLHRLAPQYAPPLPINLTVRNTRRLVVDSPFTVTFLGCLFLLDQPRNMI